MAWRIEVCMTLEALDSKLLQRALLSTLACGQVVLSLTMAVLAEAVEAVDVLTS